MTAIDPAEILDLGDEVSFAEALRAYGARWARQAERLLGIGEDLLLDSLREGDSDVDPLSLRQALTPRLRPVLEAAAALEVLATRVALPAGELPGPATAGAGVDQLEPVRAWPSPPPLIEVRDRLTAFARSRRLLADDHFGGQLELADVSIARLTVTRVVQQVGERRMWTAAEQPSLPEYADDPAAAAGAATWEPTTWLGVKAGSIRPRSCTTCGGDGRARCPQCQGTMFERCEPLEPCAVCHGTGRRYARRTALIRTVCDVCNGRGGVPCSFCAGMGRRPCTGCTDGNVGCQRCRGYGQVTEYVEGTVERTVETGVTLVGDRDGLAEQLGDHFRTLATLTRWRPVPGLPEQVAAAVRAALEDKRPGQVRLRVDIEVLPVTEVGYATVGGASRTAWLVGEEREVRAPGARWLRLPFTGLMGLP
jgi:hypothetical protein